MSDLSLREAMLLAGWPHPSEQTHLERCLEFFIVDWDFEFPPEDVSMFNYFSVGHASSWHETCARKQQPRARTASRIGMLGNFSWESPRFFVTDQRGYAVVAQHVARDIPTTKT